METVNRYEIISLGAARFEELILKDSDTTDKLIKELEGQGIQDISVDNLILDMEITEEEYTNLKAYLLFPSIGCLVDSYKMNSSIYEYNPYTNFKEYVTVEIFFDYTKEGSLNDGDDYINNTNLYIQFYTNRLPEDENPTVRLFMNSKNISLYSPLHFTCLEDFRNRMDTLTSFKHCVWNWYMNDR